MSDDTSTDRPTPDPQAHPEHPSTTPDGRVRPAGPEAQPTLAARGPGRTRMLAILATCVVVALALGWLAGPQRQNLGPARSGDPALAERVAASLGGDTDGLRSLAVAEITPDSVTWAGLGNAGAGRPPGTPPDASTPYELGSINKTFTGALLAIAIERGEARAEDTLATHLPELAGTAAGGVSLGSLAQHTSGLPAMGAAADVPGLVAVLGNGNPYASTTTRQLIEDAKVAPVNPQQPPTYSNFAFSLLGTALARAAGAPDYTTLLAERITGPVGMTETVLAASPAQIPPDAAAGFHVNGLRAPRWDGEGYLPAGSSTFTTLDDMARWAQSQLGDGPGVAAQEPTAEMGNSGIGWAWLTTPLPADETHPEQTMVWHNGGTAGFRTFLALDKDAGRAVVVLGNSAVDVDAVGVGLLFDRPAAVAIDPAVTTTAWVVAGIAALLTVSALSSALRSKSSLQAASSLVAAAFGLLLAWHSGPWFSVGGWLCGLLLAPALAAVILTAIRWKQRPLLPPKRGWLTITGLVLNLALVALMIWLF